MRPSGFASRLLVMLGLSAAAPAATAQELELLSKADARAMFAMSRVQWEANVARAVATREAQPMGTQESGFGMSTETADGILQVRPLYFDDDARPSTLQVIAGYRPSTAGSKMNDAAVGKVIAAAKI